MSWKLVLLLSLFGLAMAIATVYVIPSNVEPFYWLAIFLICAYIIAVRAPGKYFLHGFMVSIFNSVWITALHIVLFDQYVAHHQKEAEMMKAMPISPRVMMAVTGPVVGIVSGLVLGLFAFLAYRIVGRRAPRNLTST